MADPSTPEFKFQRLLSEHYRLADAWELINRFSTLFYIAEGVKQSATDAKRPATKALKRDIENNLSQIGRLLASCKTDHSSILGALTTLVKRGSINEEALKVLSEPLRDRGRAIEGEAAMLPPSLEKTLMFLRSCVDNNADAIDAIGPCIQDFQEGHPAVESLLTEVRESKVLAPSLGAESYYSTAWAIFLEHFGTSEAKAKIWLAEIETDFRRLIQEDTNNAVEWFREGLPYDTMVPTRRLWLISRSRHLTHSLRVDCEKLVDAISVWQESDGAWRHKAKNGPIDDAVEATGLALLAIAQFQNTPRYQNAIAKAATWLCQMQRSDGGWTSGEAPKHQSADVLTTAIVRLALTTSVHHEMASHIKRADAFLLSKQRPFGNWEQKPWWPAFVTAIVFECLTAKFLSVPGAVDSHYLRAARELLPHGHRLLRSSDPRDWRLGVIAIYHGLEALLYGCFLNFNPSVSIWQQKNSTQTIGLREALAELRNHQSLAHPLPYEQQIRSLASLRDAIVHRSDEITEAAARDALGPVDKVFRPQAQ